MMQAFGFSIDSSGESSSIVPLSCVHLAMSQETLEQFAKFVAFAASEMKRLGPEQFDHMHFGDSYAKAWEEGWPDIQLTRVFGA